MSHSRPCNLSPTKLVGNPTGGTVNRDTQRTYHCAGCGDRLTNAGNGLKTFRCPKHPLRMVSVLRDTSGGKEDDREARTNVVVVRRATKVLVKYPIKGLLA